MIVRTTAGDQEIHLKLDQNMSALSELFQLATVCTAARLLSARHVATKAPDKQGQRDRQVDDRCTASTVAQGCNNAVDA